MTCFDDFKNFEKDIFSRKKFNDQIQCQLSQTWKKFLPAAFGGGVLQINLLVDTILASLLGFGSVSYLYFADLSILFWMF